MTNATDTLPSEVLTKLAGGVKSTSKTERKARAMDYVLDLFGIALPIIALGGPAVGALAYFEGYPPVTILSGVILGALALIFIRCPIGQDAETFLTPLRVLLTMLHFLAVVCSMAIIPIVGLYVVIGLGTGSPITTGPVSFLIFAIANGIYLASMRD